MFSTMAHASLLALVTMVTLVSCDVTQREFSSVLDRLNLMEKQLLKQNDIIQQQNDVIQQLHQQNDAQAVQLSDLEHLNRRLMNNISKQDARLLEQEQINSQQSYKISQQDTIITKLLSKNCSPPMSLKSTTPQSVHDQDSGTSVTSTHHDVIARSDDTGALGVVVNEMNQRVTQMSAAIQALENTDIKHDSDIHSLASTNQAIHDARSSSFVCWGSSHCPHNSSLIYSGVVGGSYFNHPGAAVNYLCLTMSPVFGDDRSLSYLALLYGGEYETFDSNQNRDAVCAVCRASFSTTIMIPGTNVCTSGWTPLYSGYLMANHYQYAAGSEFVCVDAALESSPGTAHNDNGALFHFTKTLCGSLPCGPYVNDKVVTCVVCGQ